MNNYNFMNDIWYQNMKNNSMRNNNTNSSLYNPTVGYNNGNLFANLYSQYKNYRPIELTSKNEQEKLLLTISSLSFAAHDLNLYLDLHPNDQTMLALFNDYRKEVNRLTSMYEEKYGPLTITSNSLENSPFSWVKDKWPWRDNYV